MRKFLGFLLVLAALFLLSSVFMPTQLRIKEEVRIASNLAIVYNSVQNIQTLQNWLESKREKTVTQKEAHIYWEEQGRTYSCKIQTRKPQQEVMFVVQNAKKEESLTGRCTLEEIGEQQTNLRMEVSSPPTLNPFVRCSYGLDKKKIERAFQSLLGYVKEVSEAVHYERFHLSTPKVVVRDDIVFSVPKQSLLATLSQDKMQKTDSLLKNRLYRYHMLDTTRSTYLQYTAWKDSLVNYNLCIPVLRMPTEKQSLWLRGGKMALVKGQFYMATYEGAPQDVPLAWDSLYRSLAKTESLPKGLPLEELIQTTDSTEQRRLFIRIR